MNGVTPTTRCWPWVAAALVAIACGAFWLCWEDGGGDHDGRNAASTEVTAQSGAARGAGRVAAVPARGASSAPSTVQPQRRPQLRSGKVPSAADARQSAGMAGPTPASPLNFAALAKAGVLLRQERRQF